MSFEVLSDLNWLAVIVAGVAYFALGAVWYLPPVFGKVWMAAGGQTMAQTGERPNAAIYIAPLIAQIVAAIALGMLAKATGTNTFGDGIVLGLVVGVGFAVTITFRHGSVRVAETERDGLGPDQRRLPPRRSVDRRRHPRRLDVASCTNQNKATNQSVDRYRARR